MSFTIGIFEPKNEDAATTLCKLRNELSDKKMDCPWNELLSVGS